jgi:hypothetical protein
MTITRFDIYGIFAVGWLTTFGLVCLLIAKDKIPSVDTILEFSTLFNTKGGIIMSLWVAWLGCILVTVAFGVWVILHGINPQHIVVVLLLNTLTSNVSGGVGAVLFKTMTGEEPSRNGNGKHPPDPLAAPPMP